MNHAVIVSVATTVAGVVAGWQSEALAAAAACSALAAWGPISTRPVVRGHINLDPARPDLSDLREALLKAAEKSRATQRPLTLRISAPTPASSPEVRLDLDPHGDLVVRGAGKPLSLGHPGLWIPDHPLPLAIPRQRSLTMRCVACGSRRMRARIDTRDSIGPLAWSALALLAATACALDSASLLAAVLGYSVTRYLLER